MGNTKTYTIYEIQDCSIWRRFLYEVEADSPEAALELVQSGEADPADYGEHGDDTFGDSGWSVDGWQDAADELEAKCT